LVPQATELAIEAELPLFPLLHALPLTQCQRTTIGNLFGVNFAFSKIALILKKEVPKAHIPILGRNF
jgi:hypothetical protein